MLQTPMDVLEQFPIRKSKKQKQAFRDAVQAYVTGLGYGYREEKGGSGVRNIVIGDPEKAQYLITAHYDTCARMFLPNLVTPFNLFTFILYQLLLVAVLFAASAVPAVAVAYLTDSPQLGYLVWLLLYWVLLILMMVGPANRSNANDNTSGVITLLETLSTLPEHCRGKVCFVLFDLEEAGLLGSAAYRKAHKEATGRQIVLNMDCVGDGDELMLIPNKKVRQDSAKMKHLNTVSGKWGVKSLKVHEKGFSMYPSDQKNFPNGVAIAAFRRSKWAGLYYSRIHTPRDTVLDQTNVNLLRAALTTLVTTEI